MKSVYISYVCIRGGSQFETCIILPMSAENADELVKYQRTSHRETIQIHYDPELVSFRSLMDVFLSSVDPHDPDGQFIDRGFSYTLAVYYLSPEPKEAAEDRLRQLEADTGLPVYIKVEPFKSFYRAEEFHQDYYLKHPEEFHRELGESGRIRE